MLRITEAALSAIMTEVKDLIDEGKKTILRLSMAVG